MYTKSLKILNIGTGVKFTQVKRESLPGNEDTKYLYLRYSEILRLHAEIKIHCFLVILDTIGCSPYYDTYILGFGDLCMGADTAGQNHLLYPLCMHTGVINESMQMPTTTDYTMHPSKA